MPAKILSIFHKRTTKAPVQTTPVVPADSDRAPDGISPPVDQALASRENTSTLPVQRSSVPTKTFKNTIIFALGIAGNSGVPWVKMVTESVIQIVQRLESMNLNEEASRDLENTIKAFLYIVARNGGRNPDDEIVEQFKRQVQSILAEVPAPQNSVFRFINAQETRDIIARLRQSLDGAVQLLQTGLQIALVDAMDEFKAWRAGIENSASGDVIKKLLNQTYNAKGNLKMKTEGTGTISFTVQGSKFGTEKDFTQYTRGAAVTEILENSTVDADGDIDITTIATGATGIRFE